MARRQGNGINVRIPKVKVIKALESALSKLDSDYKNQEENEKKHAGKMEKWHGQIRKLAINKLGKAQDITATIRYNGTICVEYSLPAGTFVLPTEPVKDFDTINSWQYKETKDEIENAIRMLNMCDDEIINTATYGAISKYL